VNRKNHTKSGSAILLVLLVMSAIIFCGFNLFQSTILTTELVLLRQEREQLMRVTEGVLNYGISFCTNQFDFLAAQAKNKTKNWVFEVGRWKLNGETVFIGHLSVALEDQTVKLIASLFSEKACIFRMECDIERKTKKEKTKEIRFFEVQNWKTRAV